MKDFLGREIAVGDTVVYPRRGGSSVWLGKGQVLHTYHESLGAPGTVQVRAETSTGVKRTGDVPAARCVVVS